MQVIKNLVPEGPTYKVMGCAYIHTYIHTSFFSHAYAIMGSIPNTVVITSR